MNRHAVQLIARGAIDKIGNMLYDYGNSVWLASMGTVGKTVLGIYQISELVTAILANPFGGVISDRFSRRKILMTTDLVCGLLCLGISFTGCKCQLSCVLFPCFTICQSPCDPLTGCPDFFYRLRSGGIPSERRSQSSREEAFYGKRYFFGYERWTKLHLASKRNFLSLISSFQHEFLFCSL